jgi:mono/diheme cytochrome c family protein
MFFLSRQRALRTWLRMAAAAVVFFAAGHACAENPSPVTPEQERFFEEKVRPLLAANCWDCHGAKKQESGLRLDSRSAAIDGGDSGERAVVPGDPDRSLLVKAINHVGEYHMPPKRKLADDQIDALTQWVKEGLPWPAASQPMAQDKLPPADLAKAHRENHWAYQPVKRPELPLQIQNSKFRIQSAIDAFVVSKLSEKGLTPSPEANRRTLIRRLSFDLVGLPPEPEEVDAFLADKSPDAYERVVDRLLASPRFGERWARHWLDVARYGDTKGYAFQQERRYPYAYTYRDYVIRALNADLPYDEFILEQLAADQLPIAQQDKTRLAALGFLTTGRKFNNRNDDIDDQIDVVSRGLLGITVACARCHDHKYDAIPTEDYYSLYGVFGSCTEPAELPLIAEPEATAEYQKFETELNKLKAEVEKFVADKHKEFLDQTRRQSADYLARVAAGPSDTIAARLPFMSLDPKDLRPRLLERWRRYIDDTAKPEHPVLGLWHDLLKVPSDQFAEKSPPALAAWLAKPAGTSPGQCNPLVQAAFAAEAPMARMDVPRIYGKLLTTAYEQWLDAGGNDEALKKLPEDARQLAEMLLGKDSPTDVAKDDTRQFLDRAGRNKFQELQKKVESYQVTSPLAPARAMVVVDQPKPMEPRVLVRGNPARPGNVVPRQFLLVLAGEGRKPFAEGSGRLELARAITSPDNPLTRRVIVNRLWMHHFGEPLALSPSDFGVRSERPSHPELLDELATRLLEAGWSLKALHREMVCSATYRQGSGFRVQGSVEKTSEPSALKPEPRPLNPLSVDPENRLLWRMNRRRLELEAMRDTLLAVAGRLDTALYGRAVELTKAPFPRRRAVYEFIDRQDLPNFYRVFDIASPDQSSPRRPRTTVPQQSLFLMNSPFAIEQAQALAARPEVAKAVSDDQKISSLYRLVLNRSPDSDELAIGRQFIASAVPSNESKLSAWEQYAQLLLLTNEVMYVD